MGDFAVQSLNVHPMGGEFYPLLFGQGLWFGDLMYHYLINHNQCQAFGIQICNDTINPNIEMGFYTEDVFIPLVMDVSVATLTTRTPKLKELDTCTYINMYDKENWIPSK